MLSGVGLLQLGQFKILVANLSIAHSVIPGRLVSLGVNLAKSVIGQFVHQTIEKLGRTILVHSVLALRRVIVAFLDMSAFFCRATYSHHPHKLVDVIGRVAYHAAKNHQHIVHVQLSHDLVGLVLGRRHRLAHPRYMRVVPRVIVHQNGPVGHGSDLIAVVPPRHDFGVFWRVVAQPVVGLPEVVKYYLVSVAAASRQHNGRTRVRLRVANTELMPMPDRMHMTGANTSIKRTMTPAK
ncbi:hypothetical protein BpHYR1_034389 [Brachionus plicatilis]|uniref:Uncharacterized protein n=1 Tax=Brachionus plicatilis TaxID=10195 RepID=A0A3M7SVF5_BRAPC|nr:hypothetical protein BpHYR1_034389 [Brachionus plicatilis]